MGRSLSLWPLQGRLVAIVSLVTSGLVPATSQSQVVAGELNSPLACGVAVSTATCGATLSAAHLSADCCLVTEAIAGSIVDVAAVRDEAGGLIAASHYEEYCSELAVAPPRHGSVAAAPLEWNAAADANVDLGAYADAARSDAASDGWLFRQSSRPADCDGTLRLVDFDHDGANGPGRLTASSACDAIGPMAPSDWYVSLSAVRIEFQPFGSAQLAQVDVGTLHFMPFSRRSPAK